MQEFKIRRFDNGLVLVGEEIPSAASVALSILVPFGAATDPKGEEGSASVLSELSQRGAGKWSSRELSEAFEENGIQRGQGSGIEATVYSAAMLSEGLPKAIELISAIILSPHLPEDELDSVRQLALQELDALEDEPASKVTQQLMGSFYPYPFGRSDLGTREGIAALTRTGLSEDYRRRSVPERSVIGVAGKFNWDEVSRLVEKTFANWEGNCQLAKMTEFRKSDATFHLEKDTNQVQIALAYPSVGLEHRLYYPARVAASVLSGGMAGRLFVEVREKRGLVYRVSASHSAARGRAAMFASAGTTPDHAEECLQVMLKELRGVSSGVSDDELIRAKADLKSRLIIQNELSGARASALVNDWWQMERVRKVEEIKAGIDAVTIANLEEFTSEFPVKNITLVTLGPKALELK